jgi:hypothetical protein
MAVGGQLPVAAPAPAPAPVEVGLPAIAMQQDPHPRRDRGRGRRDICGGRKVHTPSRPRPGDTRPSFALARPL